MKNSKKIHFICLCSQLTDMLYAYVKLEFTVFMIKKYYIQVYILKKHTLHDTHGNIKYCFVHA